MKPRDLVALAWIPLNLLGARGDLPKGFSVSAQNIYRNKGECQKLFESLMESELITKKSDASRHVLTHEGVKSALKTQVTCQSFTTSYMKNSQTRIIPTIEDLGQIQS